MILEQPVINHVSFYCTWNIFVDHNSILTVMLGNLYKFQIEIIRMQLLSSLNIILVRIKMSDKMTCNKYLTCFRSSSNRLDVEYRKLNSFVRNSHWNHNRSFSIVSSEKWVQNSFFTYIHCMSYQSLTDRFDILVTLQLIMSKPNCYLASMVI